MDVYVSNQDSRSDEVPELGAVGDSLSSQKGNEDQDDDVVGDVFGVLDDGVSDQENSSDVLGTVAGQEESDSGVFNGISQNGFDVGFLAGVVDLLHLLDDFSDFALELFVFGILD